MLAQQPDCLNIVNGGSPTDTATFFRTQSNFNQSVSIFAGAFQPLTLFGAEITLGEFTLRLSVARKPENGRDKNTNGCSCNFGTKYTLEVQHSIAHVAHGVRLQNRGFWSRLCIPRI